MNKIRACSLTLLILFCLSANASPIFYSATDLTDTTAGVDLWQYDYSIGNNTGFDLSAFTIYFDFDLYDFQLTETFPGSGDFEVGSSEYAPPASWDAFVAPDVDILGVLEPGFFDVSSLTGGIASGSGLIDGFSVTFAYTGFGTPGSQFFEYFGVDANGESIVGSSFTQLMGSVQPIPVPGTLALVLVGLVALNRQVARQRSGQQTSQIIRQPTLKT